METFAKFAWISRVPEWDERNQFGSKQPTPEPTMEDQDTVAANKADAFDSGRKIKQEVSVHRPNINNNNGMSQCETICDEEDEELTEEENEFELGANNGQNEEDNVTDASSACDSDSTEDDIPLSERSADIQDLIQRMPNIIKEYHILSKIGEGSMHYNPFLSI